METKTTVYELRTRMGTFAYTDMQQLVDFCAGHMASAEHSEEEVRAYMSTMLPKLKYWKQRGELK